MSTKNIMIFVAGALFGGVLVLLPSSGNEEQSEIAIDEDVTGAPQTVEVVVDEEENREGYDQQISGIVQTDEAVGVVGALIVVQRRGSEESWSTRTGDSGRFHLENLPTGMFNISAFATGFAERRAADIQAGEDDVRITLTEGSNVIGQVTHGEQGVEGATVLIGGPGVFPPRSIQSGAGGRFLMEGLSPGQDLVMIGLTEGAGSGFIQKTIRGDESTMTLSLREAPALEISVNYGESGGLVENGMVEVSIASINLLTVATRIVDGRGQIGGLPEGTYHTRLIVPGHVPWEGEIAHTGEPVEIILDEGSTVTGHVQTEAGDPIEDARLNVTVRGDVAGHRWLLGETQTPRLDTRFQWDGNPIRPPSTALLSGQDGQFTYTGIPSGTVRVTATAEGYRAFDSGYFEVNGSDSVEHIVQMRAE